MPDTTDRYGLPPDDPRQLIETIRELERRIAELEGRNPMAAGVRVRDGSVTFTDVNNDPIVVIDSLGLRMYDDDGDLRTKIGLIDGTHYGLQVLDADGTTERFRADDRGMLFPYLATGVFTATNDQTTTSATFASMFSARIDQITHQGLYAWVFAYCPLGTTGEIRVKNLPAGTATAAVAVPSGGSVLQQFRWLHGATLSAGPVLFDIEARVTGGAGTVSVRSPGGLTMAHPGFCVANGVP